MSPSPHAIVPDERRKGATTPPPSPLSDLAPLLIVGGALLTLVGTVTVVLLYAGQQFGSAEWEFGTIAQTFDAMPLPTVGLVLLALGVRARGGSVALPRALAVILALAALLCLGALALFVLDIPIVLRAVQQTRSGGNPQSLAMASAGLRRGMVKVTLFATCYTVAFAWMAFRLWRTRPG